MVKCIKKCATFRACRVINFLSPRAYHRAGFDESDPPSLSLEELLGEGANRGHRRPHLI